MASTTMEYRRTGDENGDNGTYNGTSHQRRTTPSARPRPVSMPPATSATAPNDHSRQSHEGTRSSQNGSNDPNATRRATRTTVRVIGNYSLGKTLGAGSMGKVKLAYHNITGEKLAIKIIPRPGGSSNPPGAPTASFLAKQAAKDASKEIRTIREAALSMLLFHPYICGMREIIIQPNYYYMAFEFVNGGQMLDYIISHGRLRERVARKFARQIGSALEYCHKNNVAHRDLKIENILISETGNIKIIDFGLSNLYNPTTRLDTFCGSLYFAAPELLNAKPYTGPEVDIWSFGVVLYVLVCGKVPFDDSHMPALHAKIKRGIVDYPTWLSAECKHLLTRMLVVNPLQRASLTEVLNHPWMQRGFTGPPDPHLLRREPLKASELDMNVIKGMEGFEFGEPKEIERKLREVLESDSYKRAVEAFERRRDPSLRLNGTSTNGRGWITGESPSSSSTAINLASNSDRSIDAASKKQAGGSGSSRRFSGFDYYRRKFFSTSPSPPGTPSSKGALNSYYNNQSTSFGDAHRGGPELIDPTRGFDKLISIYFLCREKMERERVYGPQFASSQLSLNPPAPSTSHREDPVTLQINNTPAPPPSAYKPSTPGPAVKHTPVVVAAPSAPVGKTDYNMPLPRLPPPETSHYSGTGYDAPIAPPASAIIATAQGKGQPRPRAVDDGPTTIPEPSSPTPAGLPEAPLPAKHRRSHSMSNRPSVLRGWGTGAAEPRTAGPERTTFSEAAEDEHYESEKANQNPQQPSLFSPTGTLRSKFGTLIGHARISEDRKAAIGGLARRTSLLRAGFLAPRHSVDAPGSTSSKDAPATEEKPTEAKSITSEQAVPTSQSQPISSAFSGLHRRAQTILDPQGRGSGRHERHGSLGGANFGLGTLTRRPKTSHSPRDGTTSTPGTWGEKESSKKESSKLESDGVLVDGDETRADAAAAAHPITDDEGTSTDREIKPLYLKGLFSVATTTTRPVNVIKADIKKALDRMQIQNREIKGGFECIHTPSIDLSSVLETPGGAQFHESSAGSTIRKGIARKASKIAFPTVRRRQDKEHTPSTSNTRDDKDLPSRPSAAGATTRKELVSPSGGSSSFFHVPSMSGQPPNTTQDSSAVEDKPQEINPPSAQDPEAADPELPADLEKLVNATEIVDPPISPAAPSSPTRNKFLPPIPRDFAVTPATPSKVSNTESPSTAVPLDETFEASGNSDLVVRFEIMVVKVPLLPLHGIQFRRIAGDGWQYQMLARRVLTELKL